LEEAAKFAEEVVQPLNRVGDLEGCTRHADGSVTTPKGFKEAYRQMIDGGWVGISVPAEYGGQGLPSTMTTIVSEFIASANLAFSMYSGLTQGAIAALLHHASVEQKRTYLPKMTTGEWTGTMNLTEPHCGTDLGMLRTKAVPQADGSYKITGTKIFISAGEHDLAENIIHLCSRASKARRRHEGHLAVHRAEVLRQCRRLGRRAQWRDVRFDRTQDGHPRQFDLRDELRQRDWLVAR
jgi:alkylation response protein AidB-like acyl-CoA dehydrogenase